MRDIILTWPKSRSLQSYLDELKKAQGQGLVINFKVSNPPKEAIPSKNTVSCSFRGSPMPPKCYMVHDGYIRGYNTVLEVAYKHKGVVRDTQGGGSWPSGWYIVRDPEWHEIEPIPMSGFRGFRYFDEYRNPPK